MNTRTRKALRWNGKRTLSRLRILACLHWAEQLSSHSVILPQCFLPEGGVITPVLVAWQDCHVNKVWWDMWICVERGFSGGPSGKEPACQCRRHKRWKFDPCREEPLEEGIVTHSSILAWRIPGTEEPGRLQRVGHEWNDWAHTCVENCQPTRLWALGG